MSYNRESIAVVTKTLTLIIREAINSGKYTYAHRVLMLGLETFGKKRFNKYIVRKIPPSTMLQVLLGATTQCSLIHGSIAPKYFARIIACMPYFWLEHDMSQAKDEIEEMFLKGIFSHRTQSERHKCIDTLIDHHRARKVLFLWILSKNWDLMELEQQQEKPLEVCIHSPWTSLMLYAIRRYPYITETLEAHMPPDTVVYHPKDSKKLHAFYASFFREEWSIPTSHSD